MIQSFSWNQTSHYDLIRVAEPGQDHDRPVPGEHGRQGLLQGALLLGARARTGAVLAAVLRRAEPRRRRIVDGRARGAAEPSGRRDDLPDRPVGERAAGSACCWCSSGAWPSASSPATARRPRSRSGSARSCCRSRRCCSRTCSRRSSASPRSALMLRERDGPPSPMLLGLAGLAMGYAVTSEYPMFFVAVVLGLLPALAPRRAHPAGCRAPRRRLHRRRPARHRAAAALQPLRLPLLDAPRLLDVPRQQQGLLRHRRCPA